MVTVNETNREPDGTFEALEATGTFTDPAGISYYGAINPVQVTEEASTFAESDITLTQTNTTISNGSIQLGPVQGTTATRPEDNASNTTSAKNGLQINPNQDIEGVDIVTSTNTSGATTAYLYDSGGSTVLDSAALSGSTARLSATLTQGVDYQVVVDADGSDYTRAWFGSPSFPYTSADIDITAGVAGLDAFTSKAWAISDVTALSGDATSGNVLVEWDSGVPADLDSYDLATFQRTLDSETVTIDVEDENGNVLFSDISQNFDISTVDTSKEVKLRANLSRTNTSNNPTIDYLTRRFNRS